MYHDSFVYFYGYRREEAFSKSNTHMKENNLETAQRAAKQTIKITQEIEEEIIILRAEVVYIFHLESPAQ